MPNFYKKKENERTFAAPSQRCLLHMKFHLVLFRSHSISVTLACFPEKPSSECGSRMTAIIGAKQKRPIYHIGPAVGRCGLNMMMNEGWSNTRPFDSNTLHFKQICPYSSPLQRLMPFRDALDT